MNVVLFGDNPFPLKSVSEMNVEDCLTDVQNTGTTLTDVQNTGTIYSLDMEVVTDANASMQGHRYDVVTIGDRSGIIQILYNVVITSMALQTPSEGGPLTAHIVILATEVQHER